MPLEFDTIETKISKHKQAIKDNYKSLTDKAVAAKKGKFWGDCAEKGCTYCERNVSGVCTVYGDKGGCALSIVASDFVQDGKKEKFLAKNPAAAAFVNKGIERKAAAELLEKTVLGEDEDGIN